MFALELLGTHPSIGHSSNVIGSGPPDATIEDKRRRGPFSTTVAATPIKAVGDLKRYLRLLPADVPVARYPPLGPAVEKIEDASEVGPLMARFVDLSTHGIDVGINGPFVFIESEAEWVAWEFEKLFEE